MQRTFAMLKPDAVERGLVGEIITRFEHRGFRILGLRLLTPNLELAEKHYAVHKGKEFYERLVNYITSGPVVALVLEAENAITLVRQMMGNVKPEQAMPGTIRGDLTTDMTRNLIHGADSPEAAEYEISLWFPEMVVV